MSNHHVMTLENPAGLLITPEMLEQIGVSEGDQIEISVSENALVVRSLTAIEAERRKAATSKGAEAVDDESTATLRELINEELNARKVAWVEWIEVTLADGQKLRFHNTNDPRLDEVVKRADISKVTLSSFSQGGAPTVEDKMESIMDRYDNLFRRLAEGAK